MHEALVQPDEQKLKRHTFCFADILDLDDFSGMKKKKKKKKKPYDMEALDDALPVSVLKNKNKGFVTKLMQQ